MSTDSKKALQSLMVDADLSQFAPSKAELPVFQLMIEASHFLLNKGEGPNAIIAALIAKEAGNGGAWPHNHLATVYLRLGRTDDAWAAAHKGLKEHPRHKGLLETLLKLSLMKKDVRTFVEVSKNLCNSRDFDTDICQKIYSGIKKIKNKDVARLLELELPLHAVHRRRFVFDYIVKSGDLEIYKSLEQMPAATDIALEERIPYRIIQFWDKPTPPADVQGLIDRWKSLNPEAEHILINQDQARRMVEDTFGAAGAEAFDLCDHPSSKSDLLRYTALFKIGGIYVDADENPRTSVRPLIERSPTTLLTVRSDMETSTIGTWFCGGCAENSLFYESFHRAARHIRDGVDLSMYDSVGPGTFTAVVMDRLDRAETKGLSFVDIDVVKQFRMYTNTLEYKKNAENFWPLHEKSKKVQIIHGTQAQ